MKCIQQLLKCNYCFVYTHTHTYIHTYTRTYTRMHTHTPHEHTHTTQTHTTRAHTNTHTQSLQLVFLCSCISSEVLPSQHKVSMVAEMIHTASLAHDDVIDGAAVRRGKPSVNAKWGEKMVRLTPYCIWFALPCMV